MTSVYPYAYNKDFITASGIRAADGAMQMIFEPNRSFVQVNLAVAVHGDLLSRFPIDPMPVGARHPILEGVETLELAEEARAQNLAPRRSTATVSLA